MNKIYRFIENSSKMTFPEKIKTFCVKIIKPKNPKKLIHILSGLKIH